ncbi:MAG: hypothetical protein ABI574_05410 [Burkholderiales bacterium]
MAEAILAFDQHPADTTSGFDLGWDHARHGLTPPAEHLVAGNPVRQGWQAGRAAFGRRTRAATPAVQQWLTLRLTAWLHGRHFEALTVTPHYLAQLQASHCPITREALDARTTALTRLCVDAGYAAGHLAALSPRAAAAQDGMDLDALIEQLHQLQVQPATNTPIDTATARAQARWNRTHPELNLVQWSRMTVLRSFVTPLPHAQAAALPLLVLPPNRLRLRNPIQGLQVLVTLQLAKSGWSKRLPQLEALMPHASARRELHNFFMCLMPRVIAAGRPDDAQAKRWALEDAWRHPLVQSHWKRFALMLDGAQADAILARALDAGLMPQRAQLHTDEQATDGWALQTLGFSAQARMVPAQAAAAQRAGLRTLLAHRQVPAIVVPRQLALPMDA